ncbi:MAG: trigger factor [Treponema sp.]|nr:trigger factor [Spirochaetia bacterium]MDY2824460.1 trigger factor [Treponema sp.]
MKLTTEFTNLEKSAVKLTVTIAKKDVQESYNSIVAKYVKSAQIPGFRKGHVPANVLERKYGDAIKADALSEIIDKSLNEIFEKETENRPLPYQQPVMDQVPEFDVSKDLTYTVTFDVFPKVEVKDFAGIEVKEPQVTVGDKELEDELKAIQERNAVVMDKKADETAEKDNIVTIDYKEENGENRNGYVFTVGSADDIYKISDDVIGMKKDETKEVSKDDKKITLTVKAIKTRQLPALDDDLAQDVSEKFKTLDDLKADIKRNLEVAKTRKIAEIKSQSLLEQLVEKNAFDIPASMLAAELDGRWRMMAQQFQTTPEQLEKMIAASGQTKEAMLEQWTGDSEKMLKSRIIVDSLLRSKNISVTPEEIEAQYAKIAEDGGMTVEEVKNHYSDPRSKEWLIEDTKEQKLYEELYKEVKVSKGDKVSFADLFAAK